MGLYDINGNVVFSDDVSTGGLSALKGKVWLAMGDSYTVAQAGAYKDGVTPSTEGLWYELANTYGITLYSYGISSSTIRYSTNSASDGYSHQPMVTRVDGMISDHAIDADNVGLITFMGGGNDAESKLGVLDSTDNKTIYGALHHIFNKLVNAFPKAKIVVILQPVFGNATAPTEGEFSGFTNEQFSIYFAQLKQRAVKEVAEFYGLTICDCCFDWYTTANPAHLAAYWDSDKLHLSFEGRKKMNEKMVKTIGESLA